MCGIAAIFAYNADAPNVDRGELIAIRDRMIARGPDGEGEWISPDQRLGLAHRRLAIIDLSPSGAQPMISSDGRFVITFNGEIYNYRELRHRLEQRGCQFRSQSDTEVLLHLYAEKGAEMLNDLRGMYAFAIWDARKGGLFLARDPFGIKPLYFADDGRTIRVASQVKALLQSRHIDTAPEPAGHVGFFIWGSVPEPFTLYRGIRALPAGGTMWIDAKGGRESRSFCSIPEILGNAAQSSISNSRSSVQNADFLRDALRDTVEHHLIADVPVGVFLSAGLDSTALAAFASDKHAGVQTVTLGFEEYRDKPQDEVPLAETVARTLGTRHQTVWITRDDFVCETERLFDTMDQPASDGVNTYFVSLVARRAGLKVVLSGLGGDEVFAGYPSFRDVPRAVNALRYFQSIPAVGRAWRVVSAPLLKRFTSPKYAGLLEYGSSYGGAYLLRRGMFMPWELPEVLDADMAREGWNRLNTIAELNATANLDVFRAERRKTPGELSNRADLESKIANRNPSTDRLRVSALELCWYMRHQLLRDSDWASMAHSLELRVPLVDVNLLRTLAPLLASDRAPSKLDMARCSMRSLPDAVLNRPKSGFTIPVREWLLQGIHTENIEHGTPNIERQNHASRGLRGWAHYVYSRFSNGGVVNGKTSRGNQISRIEDSQDIDDSHNSTNRQARVLTRSNFS